MVSRFTDLRIQVCHLGYSACVVSNGAVRIDRDRDTQRGQHTDRCNGDTIDASVIDSPVPRPVRGTHTKGDDDHGICRGLHPFGDASKHHRGRSGLRLAGDVLDDLVVVRRVPLRYLSDEHSHDESDDDRYEESPYLLDTFDTAEHQRCQDRDADDRDTSS